MRLYVGSYERNLDSKRRLSVPAEYRAQLGQVGAVYVFPSLHAQCLEVRDESYMLEVSGQAKGLGELSEVSRALSGSFFSDARLVSYDGEGRVRIPDELLSEVDIQEKAEFVGMGSFFELWNPDLRKEVKKQARDLIKQSGLLSRINEPNRGTAESGGGTGGLGA